MPTEPFQHPLSLLRSASHKSCKQDMTLSVDIVWAAAAIILGILNVVQLVTFQQIQNAFFAKLALATMKAHAGDFKPLEGLLARKS